MKSMKKRVIFFLVIMALAVLPWMSAKQTAQAADKANYTIYVNRKTNLVNVINNKTKKLVRAMYCSTGKRYGTIRGTYRTITKMRWHPLYGGVYGQYCTRIHGAYLFHSVPYFKTRCDSVETVEYNKLATQASMGCIRLAVVDCKWIYDHCKLGTKVVIGEKKTLKKPSRSLLKISTSKKSGWDPTDPNKQNPYYPTLELKSGASTTVKVGSTFDPKAVLNVASAFTDQAILLEKIKVEGTVDTSKAGTYQVKYTLTDPATELKKTLAVSYKVTN